MTPAGIAPRRCPGRGFTLIELLIAVAVVAVLAGVAYPSFADQIARSRRSDALVAMLATQLAQERWRAERARYGSLVELGIAEVSGAGHYLLAVTLPSDSGYMIHASARGRQQRDRSCRNLRLGVAGTTLVYASGPDASVANPAEVNRQCWSL